MAVKDGSAVYSKILSVSLNVTNISAVIYPVPAINYIIIKTNGAQYINSTTNFYNNAGSLSIGSC